MCDHALEGEWPAATVGLDKACCFASGDRVLVASGIHDSFIGIPPEKLLAHLRQLRQQGWSIPSPSAPSLLIPNPLGIW